MSLLNAGLKVAISALNLLDFYKALTLGGGGRAVTPLQDLGRSQITTLRTVRDGKGTPSKQLSMRYRVGNAARREQLKAALGLALVWTMFQSIESTVDGVANLIIPFYGTFKTCFLLWIFFARSAASVQIVKGLIQPCLSPYERVIDPIVVGSLSLFFNITFLLSLPLAWSYVQAKRRLASFQAYWAKSVKRSSPDEFSAMPTSFSVSTPDRMPPPQRKPRRSSGGHQPLSNGGSLRKRRSDGRIASVRTTVASGERKGETGVGSPKVSSTDFQSSSDPQTIEPGRVSAVRPASLSRNLQTGSSSATSTESNSFAPTTVEGPAFVRLEGVSGGFAMIPGSPKVSQPAIKQESPVQPLSPFTPSVFPGAFGQPKKKAAPAIHRLKMPAAAKANGKKARSSLNLSPKAGAASAGRTMDSTLRKARSHQAMNGRAESDEEEAATPLFLGQADEEEGQAAVGGVTVNKIQSPLAKSPGKRRKNSSSPSPTASPVEKKAKLEVFEDEHDDAPARRTRGAIASRTSSRANSVAPAAESGSTKEEATRTIGTASRLPRSATAKTLRKASVSTAPVRPILAPKKDADVTSATSESLETNGSKLDAPPTTRGGRIASRRGNETRTGGASSTGRTSTRSSTNTKPPVSSARAAASTARRTRASVK